MGNGQQWATSGHRLIIRERLRCKVADAAKWAYTARYFEWPSAQHDHLLLQEQSANGGATLRWAALHHSVAAGELRASDGQQRVSAKQTKLSC